MATTLRIALSCPDRTGLVAAVAGRLFDLGVDLADTSFATLGKAAEFTIVCDAPDSLSEADLREALVALPELEGADLWIDRFHLPEEGDGANAITHRVIVSGGDRPGLLTRLAEAFGDYGASIVRLDSQRLSEATGLRYAMRFEVRIADDREIACLATVKNTTEELGLSCSFERL
ncbi:amino acid-binding protein [Rhodospirillum rubrum]|uniref:glycine cleavage system protein R n=1 Tax=Rhodospirillum rubrum TaxID=1085 RepID=UPI001904CF3E|nr:ACT domain-containing protein [Rhodospirillum rubrum]MBK1664338.1 amino acid-binding protein [Rhodospirillum rubrum]MBK1676783.1 amino acid-binding protein [Rhodospirillum rubrum]